MPNYIAAKLLARIADQKHAISTFAGLHRELAEIKRSSTLPEAVDIAETLLRLNTDALQRLKADLAVSLALRGETPRDRDEMTMVAHSQVAPGT